MSEVQLYWVEIPDVIDMNKIDALLDILDEEERSVYQRYRVEFKKVEFLVGRLLLKTQLGARLQISPQEIRFDKSRYGKLQLADRYYKATEQTLHFNLSHSDKMNVCCFTTYGEIGVDVEYIKKDHLAVMPRVYVPHEIAFVEAQPTREEKLFVFYLLWTRKEAYIKATGSGFSVSPLTFSVPLEMGCNTQERWEYNTFRPQPNYFISTAIAKAPSDEINYYIHELSFYELLHTTF